MGMRTKRFRTATLIAVITAGLVGLGSSPASAAPIVQDGPVNYIGPGPCPAGTTDCTIATGDVDVVQKAPTSGKNTVDCRGANCTAVQSGSVPTATPSNTATCANSTTAATSDQRCNVTQTGGENAITADVSAAPNNGVVSISTVAQQNEQRLVTSQTGTTNSLTVNATINQQANSVVDAATPVTHTQRTLLSSTNTMTATASNTANLTLNRTQSSAATGASPTQLQDDTAGSETDGAIAGLGAVRLIAKTPGTNNIKVRANDTKNQSATSLNFGTATQRQGHDEGGWTVDLSGTDTGTANAGGAVDVDLGTPGSNEGILKNWTQTAAGPLGANITRSQEQIDDIRLPLLGKSPMNVKINGRNTLNTNQGGHALCRASSAGHAQVRSVGELECNVTAGTTVRQSDVTWDAQSWGGFVYCEVNQEDCENGTLETNVKGVDIRILGAYKKSGTIPVAILSHPDDNNPATVDDATTVDPATVCFGFAPPNPASSDCTTATTSLTDLDSDGDTDRLMHFDADATGLKPASSEACLTGETYDGQAVEGCGPLPKG